MVLMYVSFVFFFIAIGILIYVLVKKDMTLSQVFRVTNVEF